MHVRRWVAAAVAAAAVAGTVATVRDDDPAARTDGGAGADGAGARGSDASARARADGAADGPRFRAVRRAIERVDRADGVRYDAKDDRGRNVEGLKVVATGAPVGSSRRYVGVAHHARGGTLDVAVVTSRDLLTWHAGATLRRDASQATIRRQADGSYLVAWERHAPRNHVAVRRYPDLGALLRAAPGAAFDAPLTLSERAEGTPDIRAVSGPPARPTVELGLHRLTDAGVDREALATLRGFSTWSARPRPGLDAQLDARGLRGNHGDRDTFVVDGRPYEVLEAQRRPDDWASWGTLLRDGRTGALAPLRMRFRFGQASYGNPTASVLPGPRGGRVLFTSAFLFTEAAPRGAGAVIAYRRLR